MVIAVASTAVRRCIGILTTRMRGVLSILFSVLVDHLDPIHQHVTTLTIVLYWVLLQSNFVIVTTVSARKGVF